MGDKKVSFIAVVCILLVFACILFWPTPVRKDWSKLAMHAKSAEMYLNEIRTETKSWNLNMNMENLELSYNTLLSDYQYGVNQVIVPKAEQSVAILQSTELETSEMIYIRDEWCAICTLYADVSIALLKGMKAKDEAALEECTNKLNDLETRCLKLENDIKSYRMKYLVIYPGI